jgi:hypothetical protein
MRPAESEGVPTVAQVVRRAVDVCDPEDNDALLGDFFQRFEDRDEPVTAYTDLGYEIARGAESMGPDFEHPAIQMAVAVATYLGYRRDEVADDPMDLLRLAARAEYDGHPPPAVAEWLARAGIQT